MATSALPCFANDVSLRHSLSISATSAVPRVASFANDAKPCRCSLRELVDSVPYVRRLRWRSEASFANEATPSGAEVAITGERTTLTRLVDSVHGEANVVSHGVGFVRRSHGADAGQRTGTVDWRRLRHAGSLAGSGLAIDKSII